MSRLEEIKAINRFRDWWPECFVVETPKDAPAVIDWIVVDASGTMKCGVEVKCRNINIACLEGVYDNKWLVTNDKIERGISVCSALCVPFYGALWLIDSELLLMKQIWSPLEGYCDGIERRETETQETINGGKIERVNAFIPMGGARRYGPLPHSR